MYDAYGGNVARLGWQAMPFKGHKIAGVKWQKLFVYVSERGVSSRFERFMHTEATEMNEAKAMS